MEIIFPYSFRRTGKEKEFLLHLNCPFSSGRYSYGLPGCLPSASCPSGFLEGDIGVLKRSIGLYSVKQGFTGSCRVPQVYIGWQR